MLCCNNAVCSSEKQANSFISEIVMLIVLADTNVSLFFISKMEKTVYI